jgi:hypothetical protein
VNVFAVIEPWRCGRVDMIQFTSQATSVDFPMPWPELTAMRIGSDGGTPSNARAGTSSPSRVRNSICQVSGPAKCLKRAAGLAPRVHGEHERQRIVIRGRDELLERVLVVGSFCNE